MYDTEDRGKNFKPRTILTTTGNFNNHGFSIDRDSELHRTIFSGWHQELMVE